MYPQNLWRFPCGFLIYHVNYKNAYFKHGYIYHFINLSDSTDQENPTHTHNCTVVYMPQCMSGNKCKELCTTVGANSYRWFHDGCCECVGNVCTNYGINESRCLDCPGIAIDIDEDMPADQLEYGENFADLSSPEKF